MITTKTFTKKSLQANNTISYHSGETVILVKPGDVEHKHKFELYAHGLSLSKYTNIDLTDSINIKYDDDTIISIESVKPNMFPPVSNKNNISIKSSFATPAKKTAAGSGTNAVRYLKTNKKNQTRLPKI